MMSDTGQRSGRVIGFPAPATARYTGVALLAALPFLVASCDLSARKLDEDIFYEGPGFRLKVSRHYENLPFHYSGGVFRVQCASARTAHSPEEEMQDAGWVTLGNGGAIGSGSAQEIAERERHKYLVIDTQTLVWVGNGLSVSFDACATFAGWYPTKLPVNWVDPLEKPDYCAPRGTGDCRHFDFTGSRAPRFSDIEVEPATGLIRFTVRSAALRGVGAVSVKSLDFGRTWSLTEHRTGIGDAPSGGQPRPPIGAPAPTSLAPSANPLFDT